MSVDAIRTVLLRDLESVAREVEAYPSDEALWRAVPGIANPGGVLARHLAGNLRHFIGVVLGESAFVRNRDDEFAARGHAREAVAAELRAAAAEVAAALDALSPAALGAPYPTAVAGHTLETERFLTHLVAHLGYHLGQIDYHRRMQDAAAQPIGAMSIEALRADGRG